MNLSIRDELHREEISRLKDIIDRLEHRLHFVKMHNYYLEDVLETHAIDYQSIDQFHNVPQPTN